MFRKLLVALDASLERNHVFEEALSLAKVLDARLKLLHILAPTDPDYPDMFSFFSPGAVDSAEPAIWQEVVNLYNDRWQKYEQQGAEALQALVDRATAAGVQTEFAQIPGDAGTGICLEAKRWGSDVIIIGRRGRSGIGEFLLGSVSNYVLHHAPCAVLVVQERGEPSQGDRTTAEATVV